MRRRRTADGGISEHAPFFLDLDRSSERQEILVGKGRAYLEYYRSGGFALREGASRAEFKAFAFRVLLVCKSAERRNNAAERLIQNNPPILTQVCLSTLAEATMNPLGPVWVQPRDYRDLTSGTPFDTERRVPTREYQTQPEREAFVEAKIRKIRIPAG